MSTQPERSAPRPDTATGVIRVTQRIATPSRIAFACIPIVAMLITPFLPFAVEPTLWLGIPAVMWWMAAIVIATVVILNVIDRSIRRQVGITGFESDELEPEHEGVR